MNIRSIVALPAILAVMTSAVNAVQDVFIVRYVSTENVYLNGGSADGLAVGHRLQLRTRNGCTAELEIVYVAEHSASCLISPDTCTIATGDRATLVTPLIVDSIQVPADSADNVNAEEIVLSTPAKPKSYARKGIANVSGSVVLLFYNWNDRSPANLDFFQSTARLNLKARHLFGSGLTFNVRTRGRFDQRQRAYSSRIGREAWENRIWEVSLAYDDPHARFNLFLGRVLPRRVPSAGFLDGAVLETKLNGKVRIGLLTGLHPQWAYDANAMSLHKSGGYITVLVGEVGSTYFEQSVAGLGEYHAGNISRELVAVHGRLGASNRWGVYHALDIDINRSWRKQKSGESLALSSVNVGAWYRFAPWIRATLSYDNRTNYWTYETRTTVDSLFDDHLRSGIRGLVDLTLPTKSQASLSFGSRSREGDADPTYSYMLSVSKTSLWRVTARGFFQYSGFDGLHEHGTNYSVRLSDNLSRTVRLAVAYGEYSYRADAYISVRTSTWYEASLDAAVGRRMFLGLGCQFNSGDDIDGLRLQSELGWRF